MKILIAEDDPVSRRILEATLTRWGYELEVATDGEQAWAALRTADAPRLAILDWMMPGIDGVEICRRLREAEGDRPAYLILLTAKGEKDDIVTGLEAGANDYVTKPFDREELRARVHVGERVVSLQNSLAERVEQLQAALSEIRQLQGILPICCYCKKIRDDRKYWQQVDQYFATHMEARFSHGICPECWEKVVQPQLEEIGCSDVPYPEET